MKPRLASNQLENGCAVQHGVAQPSAEILGEQKVPVRRGCRGGQDSENNETGLHAGKVSGSLSLGNETADLRSSEGSLHGGDL